MNIRAGTLWNGKIVHRNLQSFSFEFNYRVVDFDFKWFAIMSAFGVAIHS